MIFTEHVVFKDKYLNMLVNYKINIWRGSHITPSWCLLRADYPDQNGKLGFLRKKNWSEHPEKNH